MDYIDKLTAFRSDNDIKQQEIADLLGIKQSAYSKYEKRRSKMQIEDLIKICKHYNLSADELLGIKEKGKKNE